MTCDLWHMPFDTGQVGEVSLLSKFQLPSFDGLEWRCLEDIFKRKHLMNLLINDICRTALATLDVLKIWVTKASFCLVHGFLKLLMVFFSLQNNRELWWNLLTETSRILWYNICFCFCNISSTTILYFNRTKKSYKTNFFTNKWGPFHLGALNEKSKTTLEDKPSQNSLNTTPYICWDISVYTYQ